MLTAEPKALGASWYVASQVDSPQRARLSVELDIDVCVIGAGIAGLTAAREIALRGWSVVVLEAQSVAWNASGRNTGVVRPGFALSAPALVERVGLDRAKKLWALSVAGAEYVRAAARDMPGAALSETGWLQVSTTDHTKAMAAEAALLVGEFGTQVEPWPAERVREALSTSRYFHGLHHPHGFSLHPLNYALGLAAAAEAAGARIFEDTPALEIDPAGVRKRIVTGASRVRAAHVVLAGNVHLAGLLPQFSDTLVPVFNYAITTAPLGPALQEAIRYSGAICDGALANQYRIVGRNRVLWGSGSAALHGSPQRAAKALLREMRRLYPALCDATAEYSWCGTVGDTVHGMPQIGEISTGVWLLSGFGNHGLNTTAMGGEIVARAIVEGDRTWEQFSPFALVWAGGRLGRTAKQVFGWASWAGDVVSGLLARRREVKRLRAEAKAAKVKQFAGLAAAAAAPPVAAAMPGPVHPAITSVSAPVEASATTAPAAEIERSEELFPDIPAVAIELERPRDPEPQPFETEPSRRSEPLASAPPRRKRDQKKKKSGEARTTLAELSREIIDEQSAPAVGEQDGAGKVAPPSPSSVDKKV
jgi:glycine/D-amino acid oxidase-like deaminating enzyme